jgi:hypothetical protein
VGGALLTAAAVSTFIPGVGTVVTIGLGVAGAVALLADFIVGLFSSKHSPTVQGPGAPPLAVHRRLVDNPDSAYFGKWDASVSIQYRSYFSALTELRRESVANNIHCPTNKTKNKNKNKKKKEKKKKKKVC